MSLIGKALTEAKSVALTPTLGGKVGKIVKDVAVGYNNKGGLIGGGNEGVVLPQRPGYNIPKGISDYGVQGPKVSEVLPSVGSGSRFESALANRQAQARQEAIGRDWEGADDYRKSAAGSLKGLKSLVETGFGSAREKYLRANDANLQAKKDAIAGNRELITKNQGKDLGELASGMRKSIFNTNLALGAAAGSSASQAAGKALMNAAGKNRANVLTGYGDQISQENQNETNATEYYKLNRDKVYEWEKQQKEQAIRNYNDQKKIYDRLKEKAPSWKQADIEAESNAKLQELLAGLGGISANARAYRDQLNNTILSLVDQAEGLRAENIGIDRPAELDTPTFSEQLDPGFLDGEDNYGESFYNPNLKLKKREGSDLFDNPLVFE